MVHSSHGRRRKHERHRKELPQAQGGAQAIEDAFYLSNFIKKSEKIEIAFERFFNFRKTKVQKLVRQSRTTSKIAITNKPMEVIRNFILKHTPQNFIEKQMIELYSIDKTIAKTLYK